MKDRMADLLGGKGTVTVKSRRGESAGSEGDEQRDGGAVEKEKLLSEEHWDSIDTFLARTSRIRDNITVLEDDLKRVGKLHSTLIHEPTRQELVRELNSLVEEFHMKSRSVRDQVKEIDTDVKRAKASAKDDIETASYRIRRDQVAGIVASLANVLNKFNTEQLDYKEKSRKKISTYFSVLGREVPEEAMDDLIETGNLDEHFKGLVLGYADRQALFADVKSRKDELLKIEKSIRELAEMFHDIHLLVVSQGEMLNNIEVNVGRSVDYAVKAKDDLVSARQAQKRARYMKIGMIIGVILIIILLFFLLKMFICFYAPFICGS